MRRLEAQWPYADKHLISEAIETAVLDYLDNPSRFDPSQGKPLPNFILLVAQRRMANLERAEHRHRRTLQDLPLADKALEPFLDRSAAPPSPAEFLMAAEDDAEGERAWAPQTTVAGGIRAAANSGRPAGAQIDAERRAPLRLLRRGSWHHQQAGARTARNCQPSETSPARGPKAMGAKAAERTPGLTPRLTGGQSSTVLLAFSPFFSCDFYPGGEYTVEAALQR